VILIRFRPYRIFFNFFYCKFECGWGLENTLSKRHGLIHFRSIKSAHSGIVSMNAIAILGGILKKVAQQNPKKTGPSVKISNTNSNSNSNYILVEVRNNLLS
jgi:hypothetical protein